MATNPNAIFGEALATGPRQIPLSELQNQIAQTRQTQAQTANIGSEMALRAQQAAGLTQQNTLRQRQIEDDQAVRDTIAKYTKTVPVTAPNVSMPSPGVDQNGNPLPMSSAQHAQAAAGAVQAPHVDYDGAYLDLLQQGRIGAADTLRKSHQALETTDIENNKARLENFEKQNQRRNEIVAPVVNAPPEQQDLLAAEAGQTLQNEGLGGGVGFTKEQARDLYQRTSGLVDPITKANADLDLKRAQILNIGAEARKAAAEAGMSERELRLMDQALANPEGMGSLVDAQIDPDKYPEINARTRAAYKTAMLLGGPKAAQQVLNGATTHINTLEEGISKETNPKILAAKTQQEINARVGTQRALAGTGPFASITDQSERNRAIEDSNKLDDDYADKVGAARQLQDFVTAAQSGNKAAPGLIPIAEVRQLVNRVNRQELQSVSSGAGSAWDRIQGKIGSLVEGQPIPPDILRDINTISGTMENAAGRTYDLKRQALGRNHGIAPPPRINIPASQAAPATGGPVRVTTKAQHDALPPGTQYIDSKGNIATKGQ